MTLGSFSFRPIPKETVRRSMAAKGSDIYRAAEALTEVAATLTDMDLDNNGTSYTYKIVEYTSVANANTGLTTELASGWFPVNVTAAKEVSTSIYILYKKANA